MCIYIYIYLYIYTNHQAQITTQVSIPSLHLVQGQIFLFGKFEVLYISISFSFVMFCSSTAVHPQIIYSKCGRKSM